MFRPALAVQKIYERWVIFPSATRFDRFAYHLLT